MQILKRPEFAKLPNGTLVPWPASSDYQTAEAILRKQEALFSELQNLPNSEEGHGRGNSIKRQVANLEAMKHVCLQIYYQAWFPECHKQLNGH